MRVKTKNVFQNSKSGLVIGLIGNGPGAIGNSSAAGIKAGLFERTALLLSFLLGAWALQAGVLQNSIEHFDQEVVIDCDNDGNPEDVLELSGDLHILLTETSNPSGGVVDTLHYQPVNVSAVGSITGDTYRAVGLTRGTDVVVDDNQTTTFVNNFYMIGQQSGIKYLVHETAHVTVIDGNVVVTVDRATVSCP